MGELFIATSAVLTNVQVTPPGRDHVRDLQCWIEAASRLRYRVAHEFAHVPFVDSHHEQNRTGSTALIESTQWLSRLVAAENWLTVPPIDAGSDSMAPLSLLNGTGFGARSDSTTAPVWSRLLPHRQHAMQALGWVDSFLAFQRDVPSAGSRAGLLRVIDGILAALRLLLVLVLTALTRQLNARTFALVMLAVCLRYGRRTEPDDHTFLPMRRNLTSVGSCPHI